MNEASFQPPPRRRRAHRIVGLRSWRWRRRPAGRRSGSSRSRAGSPLVAVCCSCASESSRFRVCRSSAVAICCSSASLRALVISAYDGAGGPLGSAMRGVPHSSQNGACGRFSCWHRGQGMFNVSRVLIAQPPATDSLSTRGAAGTPRPGRPAGHGAPTLPRAGLGRQTAGSGRLAERPWPDTMAGSSDGAALTPTSCSQQPHAILGLDPPRWRPPGTGWHTRGRPAVLGGGNVWIVHTNLAKISGGGAENRPPHRKKFSGGGARRVL